MADKSLDTLVEDIQRVLTDPPVITDEQRDELANSLAGVVQQKLNRDRKEPPTLRMSNIGTPCDRKLWYKINKPELAEKMPASAYMKFLYGDILETVVLWLAKIAGHKVEGEQDELEIAGVKGHRDAIVDGITVDVKSASSFGFNKFSSGLDRASDDFGYLTQLGAYQYASAEDEKVTNPHVAGFIAVDKTLGHICVDIQRDLPKTTDYLGLIERRKAAVAQKEPPKRFYFDEKDGESGNRKLGIPCSYCEFKKTCWPGLRTFLYSNGPRHLTKVVRLPNVPEA